MQFWDVIVNTAMIGTDKKQIGATDTPAALQDVAALILDNTAIDKEEKFLQLASLAFNYRQCGTIPEQTTIQTPVAPDEVKPYCNDKAMQALNDIVIEDNMHLLRLWLQLCNNKQQLIQPGMVSVLLTTGTTQKKLQLLIADCCGKRGEWMATFNNSWNFSAVVSDDERWNTGTFEQRKELLKQTRKSDPHKAREWVQQTWEQEDVNAKVSFLEIFGDNIQRQDLSFLESLANEKSKRVRDEATHLLKQIPGSSIVRLYEKALGESVILKKEKGLLGLKSKTVLQFKVPGTIDESIFKTGIDKLCNNKEMTDDEYIVHQLMAHVPPAFWERHFEFIPEAVIDLFQKDDSGKKMITALVSATTRFKDAHWAHELGTHAATFYVDLIVLLTAREQEVLVNKFFDKFPDFIIQHAVTLEDEWSMEMTKNIFRHAAKNPHQYNKTFFNENIHLIPVGIIGELERCTPSEEQFRNSWNNQSEHIIKLITLKIQTLQAFNS